MKSRLLVALVGVPAVLAVFTVLPEFAGAAFVSLVSVTAVIELSAASAMKDYSALAPLCVLSALCVQTAVYFEAAPRYIVLGAFLFILILFTFAVAYYEKGSFQAFRGIGAAFMAGIVIPLCLSALVYLRNSDDGAFRVLIPFGAAFVGDAGALFCGMAFGKRKLAPRTSPKKTVEGAVGGIAASALFMLLYAWFIRALFAIEPDVAVMALCGAVCGILAQLGDLVFSMIKRQAGIKDYGNLLPGHGGALDRFDSMVTAAPAAVLFFLFLPPF